MPSKKIQQKYQVVRSIRQAADSGSLWRTRAHHACHGQLFEHACPWQLFPSCRCPLLSNAVTAYVTHQWDLGGNSKSTYCPKLSITSTMSYLIKKYIETNFFFREFLFLEMFRICYVSNRKCDYLYLYPAVNFLDAECPF